MVISRYGRSVRMVTDDDCTRVDWFVVDVLEEPGGTPEPVILTVAGFSCGYLG